MAITREEAERLLALARESEFLGPDAPAWIERLTPARGSRSASEPHAPSAA
jgi:hypothetical protein